MYVPIAREADAATTPGCSLPRATMQHCPSAIRGSKAAQRVIDLDE